MARRETSVAGPGSRALIVDVVRSAVTISRVELADVTGLTQPSISNIVRELIAEGIIHEIGSADSIRGKPRKLIAITPATRFGIGFHLGPDSVTCVAVDLTDIDSGGCALAARRPAGDGRVPIDVVFGVLVLISSRWLVGLTTRRRRGRGFGRGSAL